MSRGWRRVVLFGAPLLAYVAGMLHPNHVLNGGSPWLYLGVHLGWPVLACLLAWMLYLLVDGLDGRAATATRLLVVPFAVAYTSFTTFAGIGIAAFVWKGTQLSPAQQPAASVLIRNVTDSGFVGPLRLVAGALWLAAIVAAALALRGRAPAAALVLLVLGAASFAYRHERPWGAGGMAAVLAAVVWLELWPSSLRRPQPLRAS